MRRWYLESFDDLQSFASPEEMSRSSDVVGCVASFTRVIKQVLERHAPVVTSMAQGILSLREQEGADFVKHYDFHEFLDRFYTSRIGIRMLMQQHIELFCTTDGGVAPQGWVGVIDPRCKPAEVARDAAENAAFLCDQTFGSSPRYEIVLPNSKKEIEFSYVPSFLYHIVFELTKNAMRAVVETHRDSPMLPAVKIIIVEGKEDCTIKIADEGGGIARSAMPFVYSYLFSTAPRPKLLDHSDMNNAPIAGFGYGLPLSRLYARYLGGDLNLISIEGFGTDALLHLKRATAGAVENLPEFSARNKPTNGAIARM